MSKTVVCCSDQPLLAEGIRVVIEKLAEYKLAAVVSMVQALNEAVQEHQASLVIVDWCPGMGWQTLASACRASTPAKFVLMARRLTPEVAFQAREAGVFAALDSSTPPDELLETMERVLTGELVYDGVIDASARTSRTVRLTPREGELVSLLAQGLKNKEIADCLDISEGTVKVYLSRLFEKVGAKDRFELALFGLKNYANSEVYLPLEREPDHPQTEPRPRLRSLYLRSSQSVPDLRAARAASNS